MPSCWGRGHVGGLKSSLLSWLFLCPNRKYCVPELLKSLKNEPESIPYAGEEKQHHSSHLGAKYLLHSAVG